MRCDKIVRILQIIPTKKYYNEYLKAKTVKCQIYTLQFAAVIKTNPV